MEQSSFAINMGLPATCTLPFHRHGQDSALGMCRGGTPVQQVLYNIQYFNNKVKPYLLANNRCLPEPIFLKKST